MQNLDKASSSLFIDLGGIQRRFEFTMHSMSQIKALTGKNPIKGEIDFQDPDDLSILVWGGLISSDPTLDGEIIKEEGKIGVPDNAIKDSIAQVKKWLRFDRLAEVGATVRAAYDAATPVASKKK